MYKLKPKSAFAFYLVNSVSILNGKKGVLDSNGEVLDRTNKVLPDVSQKKISPSPSQSH